MSSSTRVLLAALLTACASPEEGAPPVDAASVVEVRDAASIDAPLDAPVDAPPDAAPELDAARESCPARGAVVPRAWLTGELQEVVGALSGEREIAPGVRITERASAASRDRARTYLTARLAAAGLATSLHDYGTGANVVGVLPATAPTPSPERVILGAHFDGVRVGPAAADNATGVALVIAVARWIAETQPCRARELHVVLFDEEELGLVGSEAYARRLVAERADVLAVHVFDMLSWDADGDRTLELWLPTAELRALYDTAARAHGGRVDARRFESSDHASFVDHDFRAVGLCEEFVGGDRTPHYHTAMDTYAMVDFEFLAYGTTVAVEAVGTQLEP